ncbi:AAA family ATPase [Streptomyces mesophilus]|uniref:AAA family ATPase n=1 Tax=Streptomyces mesophilus TaxID=1775132 RepID=UPI00332AE47D
MTVQHSSAYVSNGVAIPQQAGPTRRLAVVRDTEPAVVRDLRGRTAPDRLLFGPGDLVVVSGLPGSGKTTLIQRAVRAPRLDSQDSRDRWSAFMPRFLPYAVYRPLVRLAHYARLRRILRSGAEAVVHDCGTQAWVRRWLSREAHRRGTSLHLLLLDVDPDMALAGQRDRGRGVSRYAFTRHRGAVGRLVRDAEKGELPPGCASVVLLDRKAAGGLDVVGFRTA